VSGWVCCPLACSCGHVCVRRVVVSLGFFTHVSPSCSSARSGVVLFYCLLYGCVFMVRLCGSIIVSMAFLPKNKKKIYFLLACSRNVGVVT
jgi:hypothetical protein